MKKLIYTLLTMAVVVTGCGKDKGGGSGASNCVGYGSAYGAYPTGTPYAGAYGGAYRAAPTPYSYGAYTNPAAMPPGAMAHGAAPYSTYGAAGAYRPGAYPNPNGAYGAYPTPGYPAYGSPGMNGGYYPPSAGMSPYGRPGYDSGCTYGPAYGVQPYGPYGGQYPFNNFGGYTPFDINGMNSMSNDICSQYDDPQNGTYTRAVFFPGVNQVMCVEYSSFNSYMSTNNYNTMMMPGYNNVYQGCVPGSNVPANCNCISAGVNFILSAGISAGVCVY